MKLLKHVLALSIILILAATITSCVSSPEIIAARNAEKTQNWDEMIEHSLAAIETNPENPEGYYLLGQAYAGKKMYIEMIDAFDKSIETDPKFQTEIENQKQIYWSLILNEGVALQQNQQFAEAAEKFLICTKLIPDHSMGFLYLGYANAGAGQDHKAIESFQKTIELDAEDLDARYYLASLYYNDNQYDKAIAEYNYLIENVDPASETYINSIINTAFAYDLKGEGEKAIGLYTAALEKADPENVKDMKYNLARLYMQSEDFERSLTLFLEVLDADPKDFSANMGAGHAYSYLKKPAKAAEYFLNATEIEPDNSNAWLFLTRAYHEAGDNENALKAAERYEEIEGPITD